MSKVNKCKIINKRGQCQFILHSIKGQQLNEREIFSINNQEVEGMLPICVNRKGSSFELSYDLAGLINLKDFLLNPLNRENFGKLLQNILDVFKGMEAVFFKQTNLMLDFDKVMINPATQKMQFIYIPIQNFNAGGSLRSFLLDIIQRGSFVAEEDSAYVKEYIRILNNGLNFSVFELEEYIKGLISEQGYQTPKAVICHKCGTSVKLGMNFCPVCGVKVSENTGESGRQATYDPLKNLSDRTHKEEIHAERVGTQQFSDTFSRHAAGTDEPGTSVLGVDSLDEKKAYLRYEKTGEKIDISKAMFYIGRSAKNCDYVLNVNSAVSGKHAVIRKYGEKFFINDLDSTNGTFVDGKEIHQETELRSQVKVRLANEEFTFWIE